VGPNIRTIMGDKNWDVTDDVYIVAVSVGSKPFPLLKEDELPIGVSLDICMVGLQGLFCL